MSPGDLTVVVLARDEAPRIADALRATPPGAALLVLDAESTDDTAAIARAHGATVEVRAWHGFVAARRHALACVTTPWTLFLDADERLDPALIAAIAAAPGDADGYVLRRTTTLCGARVNACGWARERILRLVRTERATVAGSGRGGRHDVHERLAVPGRVVPLEGTIVHDSYPTLASYREKFERYTAIEAATRGRSAFGLAGAALQLPLRLAWGYVRWRAWRDGWRGRFVTWNSARYPLVAQWKAWRG